MKTHFRSHRGEHGEFTPCGYKVVKTIEEGRRWRLNWRLKFPIWEESTKPWRTLHINCTTRRRQNVTCMNCLRAMS